MLQQFRDRVAFVTQFRQRFETTGSITPSSRFLAQSMTRFLAARVPDKPVRVLEIGPGTGPVTNRIVELLRPDDRFDLVELNESFVGLLNRRFESDASWQQASSVSTIHQLPHQEFDHTGPYDFVISGLPLTNFPADLVRSITESYLKLLKPGGVLSYFEYMYVRPVRKVTSRGDENERIRAIDDIMSQLCNAHRIRRDNIWINVPPAWVQHLRLSEGQ